MAQVAPILPLANIKIAVQGWGGYDSKMAK
jgi:hypothetical protein